MAESNLDGMGRPSRAPGPQQANAEEMLAELVRLVESSGLAPKRSAPPVETVSEPERTDAEPMQPLEMTSPRPSVDAPPSKPSETRPVDVEPPRSRQIIFERSERNRFGDGTTFRGLDIQGFGARPCLRGSDWFDLLVQTSRARTAKGAPLHRHSAGPGHSAAAKQFDRRDFERRRGDPAERHYAAGGCQSRRAANRSERWRLAQ